MTLTSGAENKHRVETVDAPQLQRDSGCGSDARLRLLVSSNLFRWEPKRKRRRNNPASTGRRSQFQSLNVFT